MIYGGVLPFDPTKKIDWTDLSGYFRRLQKTRPSINEALLVGAGQVRGIVLGF